MKYLCRFGYFLMGSLGTWGACLRWYDYFTTGNITVHPAVLVIGTIAGLCILIDLGLVVFTGKQRILYKIIKF